MTQSLGPINDASWIAFRRIWVRHLLSHSLNQQDAPVSQSNEPLTHQFRFHYFCISSLTASIGSFFKKKVLTQKRESVCNLCNAVYVITRHTRVPIHLYTNFLFIFLNMSGAHAHWFKKWTLFFLHIYAIVSFCFLFSCILYVKNHK